MHYTLPFPRENMTRAEKEAAALDHVMNQWLSDKQKETLHHFAVTEPGSAIGMYRTARIALSFAGVQGYWPVRAVVRWMLQQRAAAKPNATV